MKRRTIRLGSCLLTLYAMIVAFGFQTIFAQTQIFIAAAGSPLGAGTYTSAYSAATADLNGDGKRDVVIVGPGSDNVFVLLGNGAGGFTPAPGSPIAVDRNPFSVAIGDLNGDGKLDLVTANGGSNTVTVLLGNGAGGFSAAAGSPFPVGGVLPYSVAIGDLNGDGKPDIAAANQESNNVSVLLGNGSGGFSAAPGSPFGVGTRPNSVAIGDLNGDGKPDLVTADVFGNSATVLLGNGSGGFSPAPGSPFAAGAQAASVAIADVNGDGKPDLVISNDASANVTVLLGNGLGGFAPAPGSPFAIGGSNPDFVAVADLNGDGKLDIVTANHNSANVTALLGNGSGGFTAAPGSPFGVGTCPRAIAIGDLNGDGRPDVVVPNECSNNVTVLLNTTGPPTLTSIAVTPANPTINVSQTQQFTATGTFSDGSSRALTSSAWTTRASMPTGRFGVATGAVNGVLFAAGGAFVNGNNCVATVEAYDTATNAWTTKTALPTPRYVSAGAVVNGIFYVIGGLQCGGTGPALGTVSAYDPATDTWTPRAPMPTARGGLAVGVVNGVIYAAGGVFFVGSGGFLTNTVEAYDPATNTWSTKAPMSAALYFNSVGAVNGVLYALGGTGNSGAVATVEAYDPATNTWTPKAPMPTTHTAGAIGTINGTLYVAGGYNSAGIPDATVLAYDPPTNTWRTDTALPTARARLAGVYCGSDRDGCNVCECTELQAPLRLTYRTADGVDRDRAF